MRNVTRDIHTQTHIRSFRSTVCCLYAYVLKSIFFLHHKFTFFTYVACLLSSSVLSGMHVYLKSTIKLWMPYRI